MTKIAVVIPGFGDPHWDHKVEILRKNLVTIQQGPWEVHCYICQYQEDKDLPEELLNDPHVPIHVVKERGILGRNLYYHAHPDKFRDFDYVMLLLDDVELIAPIDWNYVLELKQKCNMDIVSPSLATLGMSAWDFMAHIPSSIILKVMGVCELFCYLMSFEAYTKYYSFIDPENPWMWGQDFMIHTHMGFSVGLINHVKMIHYYWGKGTSHDPNHIPYPDSIRYVEKHNTTWNYLKSRPTVLAVYTTSAIQ